MASGLSPDDGNRNGSVRNAQNGSFIRRAIQNYGKKYQSNDSEFETYAFFRAFGDFIGIFSFSLIIGAFMGCVTALISFYAGLPLQSRL